jgi:hypothetical protein
VDGRVEPGHDGCPVAPQFALVAGWSLTTLEEKLIKIGAKVVGCARFCRVPDGRGRDFEEPVRRDNTE